MNSNDCGIECPNCRNTFEVDIDWIIENGRAFCPICCISFETSIKDEDIDYVGDFYD